MRGAKTKLSPEALEYLAAHSRQDEVLARVERETAGMPRAMMQISPEQGALMELLVRLAGARDALEVGTFTGYSAICVARGLPTDGRLTCLELEREYADIAQRNVEAAGLADRVTINVGPADEALEAMPEEPAFDFVFLDADKTGYPAYYELILPRMRPGALLLIDNILMDGDVVDPEPGSSAEVIAALNAKVAADERVDAAFAMVADGLAFVRKR
ncbi:MAG: class I SAM-dependent methyltransferase [Nocardioidaceae bacterium]|nr:class I SAM-dependent methyltransferase [Nocardioidaceae bacterium]